MVLIGVAIMSAIAGALAPNFGGRRDSLAALKLVGYAYTPAFIAGVLGLFPPLSFLEIFAGLWTLYVFYKGAPALVMSAPDKALAFTATCVACGIALGLAGMLVGGAVGLATGAFGAHRLGVADAGDAQGRAIAASVLGSAMGGGANNERAAENMVNAVATAAAVSDTPASGDANAQVQAGLNALNSLVRGGKAPVQPIRREQLKSVLPDSAAGLARATSEGSSGTFAGIAGSSATATYGNAQTGTVEVDVADLGNMGGIAAIANLGTTLQIESESDSGYEKNIDVDGRKVHVKWTAAAKQSSLIEIIDNRYAIGVTGSGVDVDTAIAALKGVDATKLQALGAASH
jgi:hypothetical protein